MRPVLRSPRLAWAALVGALALPSLAAADPVTVTMVTNVPLGKKPSLTIRANQRVTDVVLDLSLVDGGDEDGKHASVPMKLGAMTAGQSRVIPIGDGRIGAQHWDASLSLKVPGSEEPEWSSGLTIDTMVTQEIRIGYQRAHLFLDKHVLEFQISRPSRSLDADVTVIGTDGETIGTGKQTFANAPAGKWLALPWEPTSEAGVMQIKLHVADPGGWADETLTPWSVSIPHEEVNFPSGSAEITEAERPKLDAAYALIQAEAEKVARFDVRCSLFISGYTDTVGSRDKNQKLSVDRARAIATYLRKKGLGIKISYEGFGEDRPKVRTPDETDEPQNRRADYVLSADVTADLGQTFKWKEVK